MSSVDKVVVKFSAVKVHAVCTPTLASFVRAPPMLASMARAPPMVLIFGLLLVNEVCARGKCSPETRCLNSPDFGVSDSSTFFAPVGAHPSDISTYNLGMNANNTITPGRCKYGHTDIAGSTMSLAGTVRKCPLDGGTCGWSINWYNCTCVSREHAVNSWNPDGNWAVGGVFISMGVLLLAYNCKATVSDLRKKRWTGDGRCGPGCDVSNKGVFFFWSLVLLVFCIPGAMIGGAIYNFYLATRDFRSAPP